MDDWIDGKEKMLLKTGLSVWRHHQSAGKNSLPKINSQADFDKIGRVYHQNTPYAMPHTMFVIDRKNKNKIYYVNSQRFRFHKDFLYATGLAPLGSDIYKTEIADNSIG